MSPEQVRALTPHESETTLRTVPDVEMYRYEVVLPGWLEAHPDGALPGHYTREKTLGPAWVGGIVRFPDVEHGVLTTPAIDWEIERVEESARVDGRVVLRRLTYR
jgi:hypothetical protein